MVYDSKWRSGYSNRDFRPKYWLNKRSLAFFSKGNRYLKENLKPVDDYLRLHNAQTDWYTNNTGEIALLSSVDERNHNNIHKAASYYRETYSIEWTPLKGGADLRQKIPLRTFSDLIRNDNPSKSLCLYIVSVDDTILYVGKAIKFNPINRLCARLNPYTRGANKAFDNFLRKYNEDALALWRYQLLTLQDCQSYVVESFLLPDCDPETIKAEVIEKYNTDIPWAMTQAEKILIWLFQPCCNNTFNLFPTELPAKYSDASSWFGVQR